MERVTAADLLATIAHHCPGAPASLTGPISRRDYSEIYRASLGPGREMAIKCCQRGHERRPDRDAATRQFAALVRVKQAMAGQDPPFAVPDPVFIDPDLATLAIGWMPGQALTGKLAFPGILQGAGAGFELAGAWLGAFHSTGPLRSGHFDRQEREASLAELGAAPLAHPIFIDAQRRLTAGIVGMEAEPVSISWLHGDCKTDNFLVDRGRITGIDIALAYENAVEHDLAQFLNHLDLLCLPPHRLYLRPVRAGLESAFWRGYGRTGPAVSRRCLAWIRLWMLLNLWRSMVACRPAGIRVRLLNHLFSGLAKQLGSQLTIQAAP